ncbi:MAG: hypothetical protein NVS4B12_12650 [Ktedonobacteraceae bacterium]
MSDAHKTPNRLLQQERKERGWSQSYVAKQVNTNPFTVSRWENGITFPNSEHRLKLCELFQKSIAELGLIPPSVETRHITTIVSTAEVSPVALYDPAIPHLLHTLVGRENVLASLKHLLIEQKSTTRVAVQGLPGVGKTAVAIGLSSDKEVRAAFSGGILWASLGPRPNVFSLLNRWAKLLGLSKTQRKKFGSVEELSQALRTAIGTRSMLIVIDDVWDVVTAIILQVGGPSCTYLITTRQVHVALQWAGKATMTIHELSTDEGVTLLTHIAPVCKRVTHDAHTLAQSVGGLPLALILMGRYIRAETHNKHERRLSHALERLHSTEERLRLTQPLDPTEGISSIYERTTFSLQAVIAASDQHLSQEARSALRTLAVFPPKPNMFQEEDALTVAAVATDILDELTDAGLIESQGQGYYTIHPVISDYAKTVNDVDSVIH